MRKNYKKHYVGKDGSEGNDGHTYQHQRRPHSFDDRWHLTLIAKRSQTPRWMLGRYIISNLYEPTTQSSNKSEIEKERDRFQTFAFFEKFLERERAGARLFK